jgi:hypothetical protein
VQIQLIADAARKDGCDHPDVVRLAGLGCNGLHPGNCKRELQLMWPPMPLHDALVKIPVTQKVRRGPRLCLERVPTAVLLPHTWFSVMYHEYRSHWESLVRDSDPCEFWEAMAGWSAYEEHSVRGCADKKKVVVDWGQREGIN